MPAPANNTVAWFEIGAPDVDAARAFTTLPAPIQSTARVHF